MLSKKNIVLGITGSIAAYKSAFLVRLLVKAGANVKVIMTPASKEFITPLTLSTLSKHKVYSEFAHGESGEWNNHVELAQWADLILIAPATADVIAKMAHGICDNLLLAVYLSAKNEVMIAPAMDVDMYRHSTTKNNLQKLQSYGNKIIQPDYGELASGLIGEGRMAEPEKIVQFISSGVKKKAVVKSLTKLLGKRVLVTAGPTYETIDPVRFIGNHSSGKMGFAIAEEFADQGADVTLICGPNSLTVKKSSIRRVDVMDADGMLKECLKYFTKSDVTVMAAAVADFKPSKKVNHKIKKENLLHNIELTPTVDILARLGNIKKDNILVGFALETENEIQNARKKLHNKNLDFIVLNSLKDRMSGFGFDTNKITIIDKHSVKKYELMNKTDVAKVIIDKVTKELDK